MDLATTELRKKFDTTNAGIAAKSEAKLGNTAEAERWATQAWEANDKDEGVVYKVAVVYALTDQPAKALDKLELAVKLGKPLWEVQDGSGPQVAEERPAIQKPHRETRPLKEHSEKYRTAVTRAGLRFRYTWTRTFASLVH